ncbi:MAG TPA: RpiB/LacA/LacB family sugar-phosphate isomerase [Anaerolineae bacterium]|nr:RpiB/LacA/LacB family sugar-phosphate isomerase [Anaerolineae bacterium]
MDDELRARVRQIVERVIAEQGVRGVAASDCPEPHSIAIGADHGGFELKGTLIPTLVQREYRVLDCGTFSPAPVDYPDIAYSVAKLVSDGAAWRGIIIDGAGIGSAMVANKVPGVRAANCNDVKLATNAREHNDANVLTLGAKMVDAATALEIVRIFLTTECTEARHKKRVAKIMDVERRYLRK